MPGPQERQYGVRIRRPERPEILAGPIGDAKEAGNVYRQYRDFAREQGGEVELVTRVLPPWTTVEREAFEPREGSGRAG